ncbi:plasmid replication protein, CyRepA1 family [Paraburkholderia sp. GAS348]|uniref:plasmid replication protein, CyRepA1 family n=1 Tax=Paraburkholderia sp. GAS348 TaxID=3035132 RepID=UPI003D22FAF3
MSRKLKVAVNRRIINKIEKDNKELFGALAREFENVEVSLAELAESVDAGYPFCSQHHDTRRNANFICSDILAVDIDDGLRLEQALMKPFVQQHGGFVYTTASHTEDHHRLRIVFQLERTIADPEEMQAAYTGIIRQFAGDKSCKDACRAFYGSKGCNPMLLGNVLPNDKLDEIIALGRDPASVPDRVDPDSKKKYTVAARRSGRYIAPETDVTLDSGVTVPFYRAPFRSSLHCPVHEDDNPSAFVVQGRTGGRGVYCHTCAATFWMRTSGERASQPYDFYRVEEVIRELEHDENPNNWYEEEDPVSLRASDDPERSAYLLAKSHLPPDEVSIRDGITFIRSPKGSGKTELLKKKVEAFRLAGKSVLLVGHRRILIESLAERLGLVCYFFNDDGQSRNRRPTTNYAICVNSMGKLLEPRYNKYDVVIIDESEQVFSHLTGGTLGESRRLCYMRLFHYLAAAESVIVCDADLGPITIEGVIQAIEPSERHPDYRFYLNENREQFRDFHHYGDDAHLLRDMLKTIGEGGRHYIATNSLRKANELHEAIRQQVGDKPKIMLVTAKTTKLEAVQAFMSDIKSAILDYDVLIASPTIGTGIDITFDGDAQHIDTVFGFFVGRINTHFDIDQQISRVRHPKAIKVWVSPERYSFETEPEVILREAELSGALNDAIIRIRRDASNEIDDTYLNVYAQVMSVARASKNNLRANLAELRRRNGWNVIYVEKNEKEADAGKEVQREAKVAVAQAAATEISQAEKLSPEDYDVLADSRVPRTQDEDAAVDRFELEKFYREDISEDLVLLDDRGIYQKKLMLLETYLSPDDELMRRDLVDARFPTIVTDRQKRSLRQKVLREILTAAGLADEHYPIKHDVPITTGELGPFIAACRKNAARLQDLFEMDLRADLHRKPVTQLGLILGLMGLSTVKVDRKTTPDKKKINVYQIDGEEFDTAMYYVERRMRNDETEAEDWGQLVA